MIQILSDGNNPLNKDNLDHRPVRNIIAFTLTCLRRRSRSRDNFLMVFCMHHSPYVLFCIGLTYPQPHNPPPDWGTQFFAPPSLFPLGKLHHQCYIAPSSREKFIRESSPSQPGASRGGGLQPT